MTYILNIETSTTVCSVSIAKNGELLAIKEINNGFTHAENLHVFILEVLNKINITPQQLKAVAVSKGPGSYTGLRIGVSAAKGLCFALQIPLISINTLQLLTANVAEASSKAVYCPMLDARRMEVYTSLYDENLIELMPTEALIVTEDSILKFNDFPLIYFFGDGMPKCKSLLEKNTNFKCIDNIVPSAKSMCNLSYIKFKKQHFEDVAYFEPFYLKDFMIGKK